MEPRRYPKGDPRDQTLLLSKTVNEYIGEENESWFIDIFNESLDTKHTGFTYTAPLKEGRPPYDPKDILKLYVWSISTSLVKQEAGEGARQESGSHLAHEGPRS